MLNQRPLIVEKWLPNKVGVINLDAQYNQTANVQTICSILYFLKRDFDNNNWRTCLNKKHGVHVNELNEISLSLQNYALLRAKVDKTPLNGF